MKTLVTGSLAAVAMVTLVSFAEVKQDEGSMICSCATQIEFNHSLPMSHPVNRCASSQNTGVSWTSWIFGRSPSYQFHYLDLLELLSRVDGRSQDKKHSS